MALRIRARVLGPDDDPDALPPSAGETETLTATLRGHLIAKALRSGN